MLNVTVLILLGVCTVYVQGFCSRKYDYLYWEPQSIIKRSVDADIIVYAEIVNSPCRKPAPLTTAPPPTTETIIEKLSTNSSSNSTSNSTSNLTWNATTTQAPTTTAAPTTTVPTTVPTTAPMNGSEYVTISRHNCSTQPYNVTLKIHCVIKGGELPQYITVKGIGLGEEVCLSDYWNETVHEFHAYHEQNYTFFLKRKHNLIPKEDSFNLHLLNSQPAMVEVLDASTDLPPIFKVAGRHAHTAVGVWANKTDPMCKPYSGASSLNVIPVAMAMFFSLFAMTTSF